MAQATSNNSTPDPRWTMQEALDIFANNLLLRANFACIAANEQYKTYMVRVPIEACPDDFDLGPLAGNEAFNADFAKLMADHIKQG
jgi:hypothetical protein